MSRRVIFEDYQQAEAGDFNNVGLFARADHDNLVKDAVTTERSFAGFAVTLDTTTQIRIAPGRLYDNATFTQESDQVVSLTRHLAAVQRRRVAVVVYGQTVETQTEPRTFAVDADDQIGEPRPVPTVELRVAQLDVIGGTESADPQNPAIPIGTLLVAIVTIGTAGILSIEMQEGNRLRSMQANSRDIRALEAYRAETEPRVSGLASELAALAERTLSRASLDDVFGLQLDLAMLREQMALPTGYAQYRANGYLGTDQTDMGVSAGLALIDYGLRFPPAAENTVALDLFNANDVNARRHAGGLVLPAYDDVTVLPAPPVVGDLSLSQHSVTRHVLKTHTVMKTVTRNEWQTVNERVRSRGSKRIPVSPRRLASMRAAGSNPLPYTTMPSYKTVPVQKYVTIEEQVPVEVTEVVAQELPINGILSAETFRAPRAGWFTGFNQLFTQIDATGDVYYALTETKAGQPHLAQTLSYVMVPRGDLKRGVKTSIVMPPVLVEAGKLYAMVAITQGNHRVATVAPENWKDGTYFAGTDGEYFVGSLTQDIWMEVRMASFLRPRSELVLQTADLVGGISDIKIDAGEIVPDGTEIDYQVNLGGVWRPLDDLNGLPGRPTTAPMRAVLVGSADLMPSFYAGPGKVKVSRPALALDERSILYTLAQPANTIRLDYIAPGFVNADHDIVPQIIVGGNVYSPSVSVAPSDVDADGFAQRVRFTFALPSAVSSFVVRTRGTRAASAAPFVIASRVFATLNS